MLSVLSTERWYGHYTFQNDIIEEHFFALIKAVKTKYCKDIESYHAVHTDVTAVDFMYKYLTFSDDYKQNIGTKIYVLTLSYYVCQHDKGLFFSNFSNKNIFFDKID